MLNEIFKGMDNAAEQINENFESLEITEGQDEENGGYLILPGGFALCWINNLQCNYLSAHRLSRSWVFPVEFAEEPVVLPAMHTPNKVSMRGSSIAYDFDHNDLERVVLRVEHSAGPYVSGDTAICNVMAVGKIAL